MPYEDRKRAAADLKGIYTAATEAAALGALEEFCVAWAAHYPMISNSWKTRWTELTPFLNYPSEVPRVMYTTNAIESLNFSLRKVSRNRMAFPTTDAAMKLCYMAIQNIAKKWRMPIRYWSQALNYLAIELDGRIPV